MAPDAEAEKDDDLRVVGQVVRRGRVRGGLAIVAVGSPQRRT